MSMRESPGTVPPIVVFRPRRRCARCGLVNADLATRCRRCRESFADLNPMTESEMLLRRLRVRRIAAIVIVAGALAAIAALASELHARAFRDSQYAEQLRVVAVDVAAVERGARSDATAVARAFDDVEAKTVLGDQAAVWRDRVRRCDTLRDALRSLVPPTPQDADRQMKLDERLRTVTIPFPADHASVRTPIACDRKAPGD